MFDQPVDPLADPEGGLPDPTSDPPDVVLRLLEAFGGGTLVARRPPAARTRPAA